MHCTTTIYDDLSVVAVVPAAAAACRVSTARTNQGTAKPEPYRLPYRWQSTIDFSSCNVAAVRIVAPTVPVIEHTP
jgi:hypothetical protein